MKRKGFSMLDLLLAIAIMAILIAIMFPVLAHSKERGKSAKCIMNCKGLVQALQNYANDWGNKLPHPGGFTPEGNFPLYSDAIMPFVKNRRIFYCPSQYRIYDTSGYPSGWKKFVPRWYPSDDRMVSYGMNSLRFGQVQKPPAIYTLSLGNVPNATRVILLAETNDGSHTALALDSKNHNIDHQRHNGMSNYVFFDGHVKTLHFSDTTKFGADMWTINNHR